MADALLQGYFLHHCERQDTSLGIFWHQQYKELKLELFFYYFNATFQGLVERLSVQAALFEFLKGFDYPSLWKLYLVVACQNV